MKSTSAANSETAIVCKTNLLSQLIYLTERCGEGEPVNLLNNVTKTMEFGFLQLLTLRIADIVVGVVRFMIEMIQLMMYLIPSRAVTELCIHLT